MRKMVASLAGAVIPVLMSVGVVQGASATQALTWTRTEPRILRDGVPVAGTVTQRGLLVAGEVIDPEARTGIRAGIWTTSDGLAWLGVDLGRAGEDVGLSGVVSWRGGFVAVGARFRPVGEAPDGYFEAVTFTSPDGRVWRERMPNMGRDAMLTSVTVHRGVLVAGGCANATNFGCLFSPDARAAIWTSRDGIRWTRHLLPNGEHAMVNAVASTGTALLAVGSEFQVDTSEGDPISLPWAAAIWRGASASTLARVGSAEDPEFELGEAADALAFHGRNIVVGSVPVCAAAWRLDHKVWQFVMDFAEPCGDAGAVLTAAGAFDGRLYAVGYLLDEAARLPIWTSGDGAHWTRVAVPAGRPGIAYEGLDVVAWRGRLVILGVGWSPNGWQGVVWLARPAA